jgi:hypothetical protein
MDRNDRNGARRPLVDKVQPLFASCAKPEPLDGSSVEPDRTTHRDRGAAGSPMLDAPNGVEQGGARVKPPGCRIPQPAVQLIEKSDDPDARAPLLILVEEDADPAPLKNVSEPDEAIVLHADHGRPPWEDERDPETEDLPFSKVQAAVYSLEILGPELHLDLERLRLAINELCADQGRSPSACDLRELVERGPLHRAASRPPLGHPARPDRGGVAAGTAPNAAADSFAGGGPNPSPKSARHFSRLESSFGSS